MIAIINYGLGNIRAFANIFKKLGHAATIAVRPEDLRGATKVLLPGVGAFDYAMECLDASGMREPLDELVLERRTPVLGICVGMQILGASSEEGRRPGLGWLPGVVRKIAFSASATQRLLPHMGWNSFEPTASDALFAGLPEHPLFYYLHSYYFDCADEGYVLARAEYGTRFACAIRSQNVCGVQFHPEKSHQNGVRLLKNFAEM